MPARNNGTEVLTMPKAPSGKDYYQQPPPEERGFERKVFYLQEGERAAFDADAKAAGLSSVAYLRELWKADRARRGLPPWEPVPKPQEPQQ